MIKTQIKTQNIWIVETKTLLLLLLSLNVGEIVIYILFQWSFFSFNLSYYAMIL